MSDSDTGIFHDRCGSCGTDNEATFLIGNPQEPAAATFVCGGTGPGSANDGCGNNWARQGKEAMARHDQQDHRDKPLRLNPIAAVSRFQSVPSEQYMANWDRIFAKKASA